jgi:uncharacterized phage protein (TIGR02218 family)
MILLLQINLKHGKVIRLTNADHDIKFHTHIYNKGGNFNLSLIEQNCDLTPNNFELSGTINSTQISEDELKEGHFIDAELTLHRYASQSVNHLFTGFIRAISLVNKQFVADVLGLKDLLNSKGTQTYSKYCRTTFTGPKCGVIADNFKITAKLNKILSKVNYRLSRTDKLGPLSPAVLAIAGHDIPSIEDSGDEITLLYPPNLAPKKGDTLTIFLNCDKSFDSCCNKFGNAINFRGEPYIKPAK